MKIVKLSLILVAAVAVMFALSGTSFAFHSGGVAECMGCHEMHGATGANLLQGTDQSSTCLICHGEPGQSSYHVLTPDSQMPAGVAPLNMSPGGDFGWLKKDYYFVIRGSNNTEMGQTHGHNIIAVDEGLVGDTDNPTAPGGTFPGGQLSCVACHDMHGKARYNFGGTGYALTGQAIYTSGSYGAQPTAVSHGSYATGVYRLLNAGKSVDGVTFGAPPVAVVNSTYNRSEFFTQTRAAYGSGMSDWCGTCHADMHTGNGNNGGILRHPTDRKLTGTIAQNYNKYVKSGDMTGGIATAYLSLVPYEEGLTYSTYNINSLKSHAQTNDSYLNGPPNGNTSDQVMCLSCHRAHASGFMNMTRWQNESQFIIQDGMYPGTDNAASSIARGHSSQETAAAYYNRNVTKFSGYQRSLCNKCHAKD